ncbi:unnamed protein product [Zymoseptoria tritici ST99CH_1A5]|uniref:Mitochondrial inner membrane protease subunit n=1 Tax=Zymoseptoria tritici ST99CH_1A5 TaxID=1276529 RepID=A0A1Y6LUY7_ZYMTR|nr:unnamed protein product [Zymoseptoria tritici ST99CH_1A5]
MVFRALGRSTLYFIGSASTLIMLNDNFVEITVINGSSMSPTLSPDFATTAARDLVLWNKAYPTRRLRRGDVVLFASSTDPEETVVKRVVALPGDLVHLDPRRRPADSINGRENPAARRWDIMYDQGRGKVQIPQGHLWVEGDNWRMTRDSHMYGPVSRALVKGKAVGILWPAGRFGQKPWEEWKGKTKVVERPKGELWGDEWD